MLNNNNAVQWFGGGAKRMNLRRHVWTARRKSRWCPGMLFRVTSLQDREMTFELIPTVTMESRHFVDGPTSRDFSLIYTVRELWGPEIKSRWRFFQKSCLFGKNDPLWGNFQNIVPKGFTASWIHVFCANFVKFGRLEVDEIARCLPDQKNFGWLFCSHFCADRAQNLPGPAASNVLRVRQISSRSVHFWQSYSRTREHRSNVP